MYIEMTDQITDKKKNKFWLTAYVIILTTLLLVRDIAFISYSKWILVAICVVFFFAFSYSDLVSATFFIMPLACGLPDTYVFVAAFLFLCFKKRKINSKMLIMLIGWAALELLTSFWVLEFDATSYAKYIGYICIFFYMLYDDTDVDLEQCVRTYILGTLVLCVAIVARTLRTAPSDWLWRFSNGWFRFGMADDSSQEMVLELNANSLGYFCLVGITCGFVAFRSEKLGERVLGAVAIAFCTFTGFFTVSRTFIILGIVIYILAVGGLSRKKTSFVIFLIIITVFIFAMIRLLQNQPDLLKGFQTRFNDNTVSTGGGRTTLLKAYMDAFLNNPRLYFTGTGVTSYKEVTGIYNSMHNGLEQILVCYGVFGAIVFIISLIMPLRNIYLRGIGLIAWLPLVSVILFTQTIQFVDPHMLMLPYVIGVYSLRLGEKEEEIVYI